MVAQFGRAADAYIVRRLALMAAALTGLVVVPVAIWSSSIISLLFGARYARSSHVLALLAISAIPGAVVLVLLPMIGLRNGRQSAYAMGGILVTNVVLNLAVIPMYGAMGAASTNLACQLAIAGVLLRMTQSTFAGATGAPLISSIRSRATRADAAVAASTIT